MCGGGGGGVGVTLLKYSAKRNVLSLLLKEERVAECLMSWGDCLRCGDQSVKNL